MSFIDEMEALALVFYAGEFFTDAVITRKSASSFDPKLGKVTTSTATIPCRAAIGTGEITNDDGVSREATVVKCSVRLISGDKITIGDLDYTIGQVSETAPHGQAFAWTGEAK